MTELNPTPTLETIAELKAQYVKALKEKARATPAYNGFMTAMKDALAALEAEWRDKFAGRCLVMVDAQRGADVAEKALKSAALAYFDATGEKAIDENVSIRENPTKLTYETPDAVAWCKENMAIAVVELVDKKLFEDYARKHGDKVPFVGQTPNPVVAIKDLIPKEEGK